jgi:hypothetical protein
MLIICKSSSHEPAAIRCTAIGLPKRFYPRISRVSLGAFRTCSSNSWEGSCSPHVQYSLRPLILLVLALHFPRATTAETTLPVSWHQRPTCFCLATWCLDVAELEQKLEFH